jgi:hypothetical protein
MTAWVKASTVIPSSGKGFSVVLIVWFSSLNITSKQVFILKVY